MRRLLTIASVVMLAVQITGWKAYASEGFEDIVKVVKSGVDDKALIAFIEASPVAYALTVDEILFLSDLGLSSEIINAVAEHGKKLAGDTSVGNQPTVNVDGILAQQQAVIDQNGSVATLVEPLPSAPEPLPQQPPDESAWLQDDGVAVPPAQTIVQETVLDAPLLVAPPPENVDISMFYDVLSPYGSWLNVDGVWYWQPTAMVIDRSWQPYCQRGYWVYTDCGWMWRSAYSWGWAPFHYGRWTRHPRHGWIWQPDTTWGPAWVSWRHSDATIGWAPLPPSAQYQMGIGFLFHGSRAGDDFEFGLKSRHFTFVPVAQFCQPAPMRHRLPQVEVSRVYKTTTVIQNNYIYNDNRVINSGPEITHIQNVTHQSIKQVKVLDLNIQPGHPLRLGKISGDSLEMYRPHVSPTVRETPQTVVTRRQVGAEARRSVGLNSLAPDTYRSGSMVKTEEARGRASRETDRPAAALRVIEQPPVQSVENQRKVVDLVRQRQDEQRKAVEEAAHQREMEEQAARQRDEQRQRTVELVRQQQENQKRTLEAAANQRQAEEQASRQRDEQRQRTAELVRQEQSEGRKALEAESAQRQTEEQAARQKDAPESP